MSLSGRGRLLTHLSLCLPMWLRIWNLHRCCSGRGATVEEEGDGVVVRVDVCVCLKMAPAYVTSSSRRAILPGCPAAPGACCTAELEPRAPAADPGPAPPTDACLPPRSTRRTEKADENRLIVNDPRPSEGISVRLPTCIGLPGASLQRMLRKMWSLSAFPDCESWVLG